MNIREELFANMDLEFKRFHTRLVPNINPDRIIGVRIPVLRKIARKITDNSFDWEYYEECMLHGLYIGYSRLSYDEKLNLLDEFVPKIDNWAVCDRVCSTLKFIDKNKASFLEYIKKYMFSENEYEKRFAIVVLMDYYITDEYADFVTDYLKNIKSDFYYVNMAAAWALSFVFIKYPNKVMPLLEKSVLSDEINNMTVSKIRDSLRVDKATKEYIKQFKRVQ